MGLLLAGRSERVQLTQRYDVESSGLDEQVLVTWIERGANISLRAGARSERSVLWLAVALAVLSLLSSAPSFWRLRREPMLYYAVCLLVFFLVYMGTVYNAIHGPPPFHGTRSTRSRFLFCCLSLFFLFLSLSYLYFALCSLPLASYSAQCSG